MGQCASKKSTPVVLDDKAVFTNTLLSPQVPSDSRQNAITPISYVPAGLNDDSTVESVSASYSEGSDANKPLENTQSRDVLHNSTRQEEKEGYNPHLRADMTENKESENPSSGHTILSIASSTAREKNVSSEMDENSHALVLWNGTEGGEAKLKKGCGINGEYLTESHDSIIRTNSHE
eukprot:7862604-Ditylum_brightwellii.AAC.1